MSQTTNYVRADDGLLYEDPSIRGEREGREWFICFDDDDPPELVVQSINFPSRADAVAFAKSLLESLGIQATLNNHRTHGRFFGRDGKRSNRAHAWFLTMTGKFPAGLFIEQGHKPREKWTGVLHQPGF